MLAWEAAQLILGLTIIQLLAFHATFNRMVCELTSFKVDYHLVIGMIWYTDFKQLVDDPVSAGDLGPPCHRIASLGAREGALSEVFAVCIRHRGVVAGTGFIGSYS